MCHETHLGLGKSSEDRHQLLILGMVCLAERNVKDVDWFLMGVLATRALLSPFAPAQSCCHHPCTIQSGRAALLCPPWHPPPHRWWFVPH